MLWIVIIIGAALLSMGAMLVLLLAKDTDITRRAIESSRAYYAAESGIEQALLALSRDSAEAVLDFNIEVSNGIDATLDINNRPEMMVDEEILVELPSYRNCVRMPFVVDADVDTLVTDRQSPLTIMAEIQTDSGGAGRLYVGVQCPYDADGVGGKEQITLAETLDIVGFQVVDLMTISGLYSPPLVTDPSEVLTLSEVMNTRMAQSLDTSDAQQCIMTLQNASTEPLMVTLTGDVTPHVVEVESVGRAGKAQKRLGIGYPRPTEANCALQNNIFTQ